MLTPTPSGSTYCFDLDGDDLGQLQLLVEELDDAAQLRRDAVGDEHQPKPALLEVRFDRLPEGVGVVLVFDERRQLVGRGLRVGEARLEARAQRPGVPVGGRVGGVVEHLADDLTAQAGVAAALDFHERGNRVLVYEQVVKAPAVTAVLAVADADLTADQEPPATLVLGRLGAEQLRVAGEVVLQVALGGVRCSTISTNSPSRSTKIAHMPAI